MMVEKVRFPHAPERWVGAQTQEAANRLRGQNPNAWTLAAQLRPYVSRACRAAVATPLPINRYATLPSYTNGSAKEF